MASAARGTISTAPTALLHFAGNHKFKHMIDLIHQLGESLTRIGHRVDCRHLIERLLSIIHFLTKPREADPLLPDSDS